MIRSNPVNLDHLKLFKDIAHTRSMSKAAKMNGISQSAASQHVQELERDLDTLLLDRTTRPLELTEAGLSYQEMCRDVLRRYDDFRAALGRLKGQVEGTARVASIYSVGLSEMSRLEEEFAERNPRARLQVEYVRPDRVYQSVEADEADLGMVSYPEATKEIAVIPWREEQMVVAAAPAHPVAARRKLKPGDLEGQDFIAFDPELPIRREVDRYLRDQGVSVNVTMQFDAIPMIKEALGLGSGVSILPERMMRTEIEQGRLIAVPLGPPGLVRPLGIIHRRKKKFNRATQAFLDQLREYPNAR